MRKIKKIPSGLNKDYREIIRIINSTTSVVNRVEQLKSNNYDIYEKIKHGFKKGDIAEYRGKVYIYVNGRTKDFPKNIWVDLGSSTKKSTKSKVLTRDKMVDRAIDKIEKIKESDSIKNSNRALLTKHINNMWLNKDIDDNDYIKLLDNIA